MRFAYYDRLSPARRAIYRRSDAIATLSLPAGAALGEVVTVIRAGLAAAERDVVQRACQSLCDALASGYRVPPVRIVVLERRPSNDFGELHGLYEPAGGRTRARITVWMRTAARQQVVAFKSFLRTVAHELCHHLDYELYALEESFHTEGFYKRESGLVNALVAQAGAGGAPPGR